MKYEHISVLLQPAIELLQLQKGYQVIDATLGGAGHTAALLKHVGKKGRVLAIDADEQAIKNAQDKLPEAIKNKQLILVNDNFVNLKQISYDCEFNQVNAILFDLGLSSYELQDQTRGFSFQIKAPLDMRFDKKHGLTAADIVNKYKEKDLTDMIYQYGEEQFSRRIAKAIVQQRKEQPIQDTAALVQIIESAVPSFYKRRKIHCATKTFQALRIAVNNELNHLSDALEQAIDILQPGGRLAVISFHSLEDRIVKQYFNQESKDCLCPPEALICHCSHQARIKKVTKKPLMPDEQEIKDNPRSRSAKLRVVAKI